MPVLLVKISTIARSAGCLAIAAAIALTALHLQTINQSSAQDARVVPVDAASLTSRLAHCQAIGMAAQNDAACDAAWTENRRRFFTVRPSDYPPVKQPIDQLPAAIAEGR